MEPISKSTWEEMGGKAKWDSIVALRGPDLKGSELLKMFTTSVIRHRLSGVMRVGGQISQLGCIVVPNGAIIKSDKFDDQHFFAHVREAAYHLAIPIVSMEASVYKAAMDTGSTSEACKVFLRAIEESQYKASNIDAIKDALQKGTKGYF